MIIMSEWLLTDDRLGWDQVGTLPYGDRFRKHRRLISQVLNSQAVFAYHGLQENSTRRLVKGILNDPKSFDKLVFRYFFYFLP